MALRSLGDALPSSPTDLLALVQGMAERAKSKPRPPEAPRQPIAVQLPLWGDEIRCMPNEILRSALFNARNRNQPRRYFKNEAIAIIDQSARISFTGEELRQNDESVWLQLIHLAKEVPIGHPVEFTAYSMVQALRLTKSYPSANHIDQLCSSLQRMQATSLSIHSPRLGKGVSLSMIPKFEWLDEVTGVRLHIWRVFVAPEMVELFGNVHFTHLEWGQRLALPTGLATWLHGYYASHSRPFAIRLSTLQNASGCTAIDAKKIVESEQARRLTDTQKAHLLKVKEQANARKFKQQVDAALAELVRVGFLKWGEIRGDLVHVERL
ncbi:MAG: plasmid replication initiator TrfA [Ferrovum myxofaciens]